MTEATFSAMAQTGDLPCPRTSELTRLKMIITQTPLRISFAGGGREWTE